MSILSEQIRDSSGQPHQNPNHTASVAHPPFRRPRSSNQVIVVIVLILLMVGLGTSIYLVQQQQEIRSRAYEYPYPYPQPPECTSFTSVWINSCTPLSKYSSSDPACRTTVAQVTVNNTVTNATDVRYIDTPLGTECANVSSDDSGWSAWAPYTASVTRTLPNVDTEGDRKICAEFRNSDGSVKCGGIIKYIPETTGFASVNMTIRAQGVQPGADSLPFTITLRSNGVSSVYQVSGSADSSGIISLPITDVPVGTYDMYIRGWAHLQRKVSDIAIISGTNTLDLTPILLYAGDVQGDGADFDDSIDALDIGRISQDWDETGPILTRADINRDGLVNGIDASYVLQNYYLKGHSVSD